MGEMVKALSNWEMYQLNEQIHFVQLREMKMVNVVSRYADRKIMVGNLLC